MVLLDTNVFVIDRFFPRDPHFADNKRFLNLLPTIDAGFAIFSLMELCGIASFNLSPSELQRWLYSFEDVYPVKLISPSNLTSQIPADAWFVAFLNSATQRMTRKATWGDAMVIVAAEQASAEAIITWNTRHFIGRTAIDILTPLEYLTR